MGEPEICKMGECACNTQVWVAHDCTEAKICPDTTVTCNETHPYINVNLITHDWFCSTDDDNCLGSFHVGCQEDSYNPDNGAGRDRKTKQNKIISQNKKAKNQAKT